MAGTGVAKTATSGSQHERNAQCCEACDAEPACDAWVQVADWDEDDADKVRAIDN